MINFWENVKRKNSVHTIEFWVKKADWKGWLEKFLLCGKHKGYEKLLVSSGSTSGMDKIPTQDEYKNALKSYTNLDKKNVKLVGS